MTNEYSEPKNTRRKFIGKLAAGAAAIGLAPLFYSYKVEDKAPVVTGKKTAADKLAFDVSKVNEGRFLNWIHTFLSTNNETGSSDEEITAVVVLRSGGILLGLSNEIWEKYKIGETFKITDGLTKAPSVRNILWKSKDGDDYFPDKSIDALQKRGVLFCICSKALDGFAERMADEKKLNKEEVTKEFYDNLLPEIQLMPSGIWALGRVQEKGCGYCYAG
jgi:intracellular sulfur oxidation DsrE/DsrF family protein